MKAFLKELKETVDNNAYIMKLAWSFCPKRVVCGGIWKGLYFLEWIFYAGVFMKKIVELIERNASFGDVMLFIVLTEAVFFLVNLFNSWFTNLVQPTTDIDVYRGLYRRVYEKAQNADLACYENSEFYNKYMLAIGEADKRFISTMDNIWGILMGFLAVIASLILMMQIDKWLVLFVVAPMIGNFLFGTRLNKITYKIYEESVVFKRIADYVNRMVHLADYAKDIRMTGIFHVMREKHRDSMKENVKIIDKYKKDSILCGWGFMFLIYTAIFEGVMFYGAYRSLISESVTLAQFTILSGLMVALSSNLRDFANALKDSFQNSFFIANLRRFLEYKPQIPEDSDGLVPEPFVKEIEFRHVSFGYKEGSLILKDVSFRIEAGRTCALVGFNGAGKSTIIKLLLRLYDPAEGEILVNGIPIQKYRLADYRRLYATAFQDGRIFARTIRDNVWMRPVEKGEEHKVEKKIWEALELAGIREEVEKLPKRLDSVLTKEFADDGVILSGGQYQKILAARAFAAQKSVLIFDEPSSALDPIAEHQLFQSIGKAREGKLLFFISHRLSSVQSAQEILLLKNGRILERGSHKELMKAGGEYAGIYRMQAENYQADTEEGWVRGSIFTSHLEA